MKTDQSKDKMNINDFYLWVIVMVTDFTRNVDPKAKITLEEWIKLLLDWAKFVPEKKND